MKKYILVLLIIQTISCTASNEQSRIKSMFYAVQQRFYQTPLFAGWRASKVEKEAIQEEIEQLTEELEILKHKLYHCRSSACKKETFFAIIELKRKIKSKKLFIGQEWSTPRKVITSIAGIFFGVSTGDFLWSLMHRNSTATLIKNSPTTYFKIKDPQGLESLNLNNLIDASTTIADLKNYTLIPTTKAEFDQPTPGIVYIKFNNLKTKIENKKLIPQRQLVDHNGKVIAPEPTDWSTMPNGVYTWQDYDPIKGEWSVVGKKDVRNFP